MTVRRIWRGLLAALVIVVCVPGAVRGTVWVLGAPVIGPAVLAGPHVTQWDVSYTSFGENFGGLSGLLIEGSSLIAAGDRGALFVAHVQRDTDGWLEVPTQTDMIRLPQMSDLPTTKVETNLEGLAWAENGDIILAFEGFARIDTLQALDAIPEATHRWNRFEANFGNAAFEATVALPDGTMLAILEGPFEASSTSAYRWDSVQGNDGWSERIDMPLSDGFVIIGADIGADGCLYLLDRKFTLASGFSHRLRRVARLGDLGGVIYASAPAVLGNAEGVSMTELTNGGLIATLITDDNFLPLTPTRLIEYRLTPGTSCDGVF
jgi:hypothetical protein